MTEEILDIVDENDNIIGQESRQTCHDKKLRHRGSAVLTFYDNTFQKMLLQKRSKTKSVNPSKLCVPGGHLSAGDDYLEGATREFSEEMYDVPNKKIELEELFKIKKEADNDPEFVMVYRIIDPGLFNIDKVETQKCFFIDINKLKEKIKTEPQKFTESSIVIIEEYLKRYNQKSTY